MEKLSKSDALRKCIVVFEAIKRAASKGNAGIEPERGAEESFYLDCQVLERLREMLLDMMETEKAEKIRKDINRTIKDWQQDLMDNGLPERMTL